jgi:hypothetical protein
MAGTTVVEIALARIRLVRGGESAAHDQVAFHGGRPSRLVVGSDDSAGWQLPRTDVAPRQLDVVWDGSELWLQDALRLGRTFVNGRTLNEWMPVVRQAIVCFGGVQLFMESRAKPSGQQSPDFAALDRARLTDAHQNASLRLSDTTRITLTPDVLRALNERGAQ